MEFYLVMVLLIGYISILSAQKPNYRKNITKLRTVKAATVKGDKDIYLRHSN